MSRFLEEMPPLGNTLGKAELEYAAAVILWALKQMDREWSAEIKAKEIGALLTGAIAEGVEPAKRWSDNPFFRPDFAGLASKGLSIVKKTPDGDVMQLTTLCLEKVKAHL